MGEVRSLKKNDFFYFAQFPLNFGWFVELLIGYCELQLTKIIKPYLGYRFSSRKAHRYFQRIRYGLSQHRTESSVSRRRDRILYSHHHSSDCLPAEKFPTLASGRQGRGPIRLLDFRHQSHLTMPCDVAQEESPAYGDGSVLPTH